MRFATGGRNCFRAALTICLTAVLLGATAGFAQTRPQPEGPSGFAPRKAALAHRYMAAAANPLAAAAGQEILRKGGSAVDAVIAMQMVLTLVEPQSSGIGGGAFLVHYDASNRTIETYDGRETAPAAATSDMFLDAEGKPQPFAEAAAGGIAVGTPGVLRMLELAHREHGRLPWPRLFEPAIRLAQEGFLVSRRLSRLIAENRQLRDFPAARIYFYDANGEPRAVGARLTNPALAETLRLVANGGASVFYKGPIADDIAAAVRAGGARPGQLAASDLAGYQAVKRPPVCGVYRELRVCGMGPPSSGGIAVAQTLGILENFDLAAMTPGSLETVHLISEATKLAFADRARYVADSDFVPVPVAGLIAPRYLAQRASLIDPKISMGRAEAGRPGDFSFRLPERTVDDTIEIPATSHISVVDAAGNSIAMTTSIEQAFGSRIMVRGFLLNNQMTDFAFRPRDGETLAPNRVEPGKRPRSSMAPTIVTDRQGRLALSVGSVGGSRIIPYVVETLVAVLDWGLDMQQAISLPRHTNLNGATDLERGTPLLGLADGLRALGHTVEILPLTSGTQGIAVVRRGSKTRLIGGVDPRREGRALGD
ncbi:MAG: gamma-glutamyltransferase [Rhodospirillales bacterium]|nr:gamma-glutamyltransferase [Rhodospirillales bacterium]